ncbi:hypothetical protein JYK14_04275 [Siccirubricoccus sp. KC 17139]|uniref:Uncharacterized protein n=1 Tax=Siccirubricoccus soli TaxID=2899147 RepID=A0ABT1D0F1_9PROT|nr:hypothetical protein [Siccirubricoccus soli]MCO6415393.1 hypothetical protein [Siccirubricoccus soli]MCP2681525.1 hypothetical protein [Siccirubricoccus soli]
MLDRSPQLRLLIEWGTAQDGSAAPRGGTAAMFAGRGYLAFTVAPDGGLRPITWDAALALRELTNLVLLKANDPLLV